MFFSFIGDVIEVLFFVPFLQLFQSLSGLAYAGLLGFLWIAGGRFVLLRKHGVCAPRIEGFGRLPGFSQIVFRVFQIAFLHGRVRRVEVRRRIFGIHAYGRFEYFVEFVRTGAAGLCGQVEFVETQFLRLREHDVPDLLRVAERADGVRDPVVRMAQRGIAVFQQEIVLFGIGAFDFRLLGVGFERTVDQGEYLRAVRQVRAFDIAAQSGPVLRFVIGFDDPLIEAVELSDMFFSASVRPMASMRLCVHGLSGDA